MNTTTFRGAIKATAAAFVAASILVATPATAGAAAPRPMRTATVAAAATVPAGFVKHVAPHWTWFGPKGWIASTGVYGITVNSPAGRAYWDYGASSTLCAAAKTWPASAAANFAQRRAQLKAGARASRWTWLSIGAVQTIGTRSYRQVVNFDAVVGGTTWRARVQFVYSDNGGGYCYQSSDARVVVKSIFTKTLPTLNAIAANTFYRGPGVCDPNYFDPKIC
jgi:hypothetical protein